MNAMLGMIGFIVFMLFSIAQLIAAWAGLEYYIGAFWTGIVIFVAVTFRFTLPITIGAFLGAMKVWGWHWALAVLFTAPGLVFVAPGVLAAMFLMIKNKRTETMSLLVIMPLLLAFGCATNKGGYRTEQAVENQLMTMTKEEVLMDLGPPTKKAALEGDRESWRYESAVGGLTGGECTLSILFLDNKVIQAKLSANDLSWVSWPLGSCTKIIQTLR